MTYSTSWETRLTIGLGVGLVVHYVPAMLDAQVLWDSHAWVALTLLALAHQLDLRLRSLLTQTQGEYPLDRRGLKHLKEEVGFESELIDDRDLNQQLIFYHGDISDHDSDDSSSDSSDSCDPASPHQTHRPAPKPPA